MSAKSYALVADTDELDIFSPQPEWEEFWLNLGRVSIKVEVTDEGSVTVKAYPQGCELPENCLADFYVSWQDLPDPDKACT